MSITGNEVAAVVVTYNRKELLRTTINKLLNQIEKTGKEGRT